MSLATFHDRSLTPARNLLLMKFSKSIHFSKSSSTLPDCLNSSSDIPSINTLLKSNTIPTLLRSARGANEPVLMSTADKVSAADIPASIKTNLFFISSDFIGTNIHKIPVIPKIYCNFASRYTGGTTCRFDYGRGKSGQERAPRCGNRRREKSFDIRNRK